MIYGLHFFTWLLIKFPHMNPHPFSKPTMLQKGSPLSIDPAEVQELCSAWLESHALLHHITSTMKELIRDCQGNGIS